MLFQTTHMPGPSCRVTSRCLQLHSRLPGAGRMTFLSRVICSSTWQKCSYRVAQATGSATTRCSSVQAVPQPQPNAPGTSHEHLLLKALKEIMTISDF